MKRISKWLSLILSLCLLCAAFAPVMAEDEEILFAVPVEEAVDEVSGFELDDLGDGVEDVPVAIEAEAFESLDAMAGIEANAGSSIDTATRIGFDTTYNGSITETNSADFYSFTLPSSGCVTFSATAKMEYVYYYLYNASGNQLWYTEPYWNTTTHESVISPGLRLTNGTYYIAVKRAGSRTGAYSFTLTFESANETFAETGSGSNNSLDTASNVAFDATVNGQIAINDSTDFFKVTLSSSGCVTFAATAKMEYVYYYLYDATGKQLWYQEPYWNTTTHESVITPGLRLASGTYYIAVKQTGSRTGTYSFNLTFESANETFAETSGGSNNSLDTASVVAFDVPVKGQIAMNDTSDFFKLTLPSSGRVIFSASAKMEYVYYYLYDATGKQLWYNEPYWNTTTRESVISPALDLSVGTYYLAVKQVGSRTGTYAFVLTFESANESFAETGADNSIDGANSIALRQSYNGQLAINDEKDFYTLTLSSDAELTFNLNAPCEYVYLALYDSAGTQIWKDNPHWNSTTQKIEYAKNWNLSAGTYYLCVFKDGSRTTPYTIRIAGAGDPVESTPTPEPTSTPAPTPAPTPTDEPLDELIDIEACDIDNIPAQVYTGKAIKPNPVVEYDGELLVKGVDYKLSYKNNKAIGTATVTIKGIGNYTGTVKETFKIRPKPVTLSKVTGGKKKLTVQWKKGTGGITGYQLQYSLKKNMASAKTVTVKGIKTVKKAITKLKAKKTYYVRIRAYKKVSGKTYYSAWSKVKSANTK